VQTEAKRRLSPTGWVLVQGYQVVCSKVKNMGAINLRGPWRGLGWPLWGEQDHIYA